MTWHASGRTIEVPVEGQVRTRVYRPPGVAVTAVQERDARWLDVVADLLQRPLTTLPYVHLLRELVETFEARGGGWTCRDAAGKVTARMWPADHIQPEEIVRWHQEHRLDDHPLLRWFARSRSSAAQSVERVPRAVADARCQAAWREVARPYAIDDQLSMPLAAGGLEFRTFVLSRENEPFDERDLALARRLQVLLIGLERQSAALAELMPAVAGEVVADVPLTARELAVIGQLARGHSAAAIGRRLGISERTVHKHLEHAYRKLKAPDRLSAVLAARRLGLVSALPGG